MIFLLQQASSFLENPPSPPADKGGVFPFIQRLSGSQGLVIAFVIVMFILLILIILLIGTIMRSMRSESKDPQPSVYVPDRIEAKTDPGKRQDEYGIQLIKADKSQQVLKHLPAVIGCHPANDVVLDSDAISDRHARLYYDSRLRSVCIEDLGSQNGIKVNGKPTLRNLLQSNDKISIADLVITYKDTGYIPEQNI